MKHLSASDRMKLSAQLLVLSGELSRNILTLIQTYEAAAENLSKQGSLVGSPILSMKAPLETISEAFLKMFPQPTSTEKSGSYTDGVLADAYRSHLQTAPERKKSKNSLQNMGEVLAPDWNTHKQII